MRMDEAKDSCGIGLDKIGVGECAVIAALKLGDGERRRLIDLGFYPGATVICVGRSPMGDPRAYSVCGAVVAIRNPDAEHIIVNEVLYGE